MFYVTPVLRWGPFGLMGPYIEVDDIAVHRPVSKLVSQKQHASTSCTLQYQYLRQVEVVPFPLTFSKCMRRSDVQTQVKRNAAVTILHLPAYTHTLRTPVFDFQRLSIEVRMRLHHCLSKTDARGHK